SVVLPTHNPKIMISSAPAGDFEKIKEKAEKIVRTATKKEDQNVVRLLKELVPEFKSENSVFSKLDKPKVKAISKI
ncbi:MAG: polysaccharide biosynthesis protein, partial [Marinirhabdus sp.]|nr:polysaccharide biosynthesis protein [Marinirhabdus sp.]